jgi:hypothetical protein
MPAEKVIQFSDYQSEPKGSSLSQKGDIKNLTKSPGNMGFQGTPVTPLWEHSEEPIKARSEGQEPETDVSHISDETKVSPIAKMTFGQLKAAYPREFQSWKNGKFRCKVKGWPWAGEWKSFKDFMLSKGPILEPGDYTLDRIDNAVEEYGPGLCRWASKTVQNNNKSNNLKVVVPLTGEVLTPKKVAKRHGVTHKTACKWFATYSPYELLIGKKSKALHAAWIAVDDHLLASAKAAPAKKTVPAKKAVPAPAGAPGNPYPPGHCAHIQFQRNAEYAEYHRREYGCEYCVWPLAWNDDEDCREFGLITPEEHERGFVKWWTEWKPHVRRNEFPSYMQELIAKIETPGYVLPTIVPIKYPDPAEIASWWKSQKPRDRTDAERAKREQEDVLLKEWEEQCFVRERARLQSIARVDSAGA